MELENALAEAAQGEQGLGWLQGRDLHYTSGSIYISTGPKTIG